MSMPPVVSVVILAAGESRRMGQPKLLLPWGQRTVLEQVIATFAAAIPFITESDSPSGEILIITGGAREQVEPRLEELNDRYPLRAVFNPNFATSGMIGSIQAGLQILPAFVEAAIIGLGDQPQVQERTIRAIVSAYKQTRALLVVPSFNNQRGHPWLVDRSLWPEMLSLPASATSRQFLSTHASQVEYVLADTSVLQDLDTPADYERLKP
jgi:molybdenum cofactor cytidylyltransferase